MDYKEMIGFIVEQFNANHYGEFIKDGKVLNNVSVFQLSNGIDIEMTYRDIGSVCRFQQYPFEKDRTAQEALTASSTVMVGDLFWEMCLEEVLTDFADFCFYRFSGWTGRSIFKTDTVNTRVIHVRFEMPRPMSGKKLTRRARLLQHSDIMQAKFCISQIPGAYIIRKMRPIKITPIYKCSPRGYRDDRYNSGSYSDYDEWCDYLDEVCGRD